MKDIMLADTPVEQRAQILRDSCDQIVERSYTRKFDQEEINERRADLANVAIQKADLEQSLAEIRADYKGKIKPLEERIVKLRDELKAGASRRISPSCWPKKSARATCPRPFSTA